jgi:hypothetical protein
MARAVLLVVAGFVACAGCRPEEEFQGPDLSSAALYCPPAPPSDDSYVCDRSAIPYCTYPGQATCTCTMIGGQYVLHCGVEISPDGGVPTGT